jgi:hypothetical protein
MPAGKRERYGEPKAVSPLAVQPISPLFVPTMVVLRRIFFIDTDKTRYVTVGFYPARNYEFGGPKLRHIVLVDKYVRTLAEHLPELCEKMFHDEQYRCENGDLRLSKTRGYRTARLKLGDNYIVYRLRDFSICFVFSILYMRSRCVTWKLFLMS